MFRLWMILIGLLAFQLDLFCEEIQTNWPDGEPPLLFVVKGLGNGYGPPAVTENRIYVTGETEKTGYLFAFDLRGKELWKSSYGEEWTVSYPGSRSAPTLAGNLIYVCSGMGELTCFDVNDGSKKWSIHLITDLEGTNVTYGYAMPPVVHGDQLICSPGGEKNNIVALNRFTGDLIWSSPGVGETAGYGSPLLIDLLSRTILVTSSEFFILGLDAGNGELLWKYELAFKGELPCNEPLFDGTTLYWIAGPGNGAVAANLSADGASIDIVWKNKEFDTFFGAFVKIGDFLYGSSDSRRKYVSVDATSGKILHELPFSLGAITKTNNRLIGYNQRGQVGFIHVDKDKMDLVSSFKISSGTNEHFSLPVVDDGLLFIRHGDSLLAYDIRSN